MSQATMPLGVTAVMFPELDFNEQIALCQKTGVTHYSVRPRVIPDNAKDQPWFYWGNHKYDLTPEMLVKQGPTIKKQLEDAGLTVFGTVPTAAAAMSNDEIQVHLDGAAAVGAGRLRVGPLNVPADPFDYQSLLKQTIDAYARIVELAEPMGLKLVIETHARSLATSPGLALNICKNFTPQQVGVIFDIANYGVEGAVQPQLAVSVLKDYIDHCHVGGTKRIAGEYDALGFRNSATQMCPMTASDMHIPSWIEALRKADVDVPLIIEDYTYNVPSEIRLTNCANELNRIKDSLD